MKYRFTTPYITLERIAIAEHVSDIIINNFAEGDPIADDDPRLTDEWCQSVAERWYTDEGLGSIWDDEDTFTEEFETEVCNRFKPDR